MALRPLRGQSRASAERVKGAFGVAARSASPTLDSLRSVLNLADTRAKAEPGRSRVHSSATAANCSLAGRLPDQHRDALEELGRDVSADADEYLAGDAEGSWMSRFRGLPRSWASIVMSRLRISSGSSGRPSISGTPRYADVTGEGVGRGSASLKERVILCWWRRDDHAWPG